MTRVEQQRPASPTAVEAGTDFHRLLGAFKTTLEVELERFLAAKEASAADLGRSTPELTRPLREFVLRGGKRLRPAFVSMACRAAGDGGDEVLPVAMSIELLHTYLLIHDDIMDRAETRRGGSAAHRQFADDHRSRRWRGSPERHGESTAILLGDLAHSYAVELFLTASVSEARRHEAGRIFGQMCQEVVVGQYLELTAPQRQGLDRGDLLRILRLKSGRYSVERPIQLGAVLGGARPRLLAGLRRYGLAVGEAFQLQDDLLGVFGELETVGKPVGGDLREGKFTLLIFEALERAGDRDRRRIEHCLRSESPSPEEIHAIRARIEALGARLKIEEMIAERLALARETLESLELTGEGRVFFEGVIDYLNGRRT